MKKEFPNYLNKAGLFAEVIKKLVTQYSKENIHQVDNFHKIETNLEKAVEATKSSISKVINRGKTMSSLIERTGELSSGIGDLKKKAKRLHKNFWKSKIKALSALFVIGIIIVYCFMIWISQKEP